jgi:hypothetical protein
METKIILNEQQLNRLNEGKKVKCSLFMMRMSDGQNAIGVNEYQQSSGKRRHAQQLHALPHGWIRKTPRLYKLSVSVPHDLGERRVGELMEVEGVEAHNFMNSLDSILNNV